MNNNSILDVVSILDDYSKYIQEGIEDSAVEVAKKGASTLKKTSPVNKKKTSHKGKYAKGWRTKTEKSFGSVNVIIHNATDYQLTHLLEKPHLTRNGGITKPNVHIKPVEDTCINEYERKVEEVIQNA